MTDPVSALVAALRVDEEYLLREMHGPTAQLIGLRIGKAATAISTLQGERDALANVLEDTQGASGRNVARTAPSRGNRGADQCKPSRHPFPHGAPAMADMTLCRSNDCPARSRCLRNEACPDAYRPSERRQSYAFWYPEAGPACPGFIEWATMESGK